MNVSKGNIRQGIRELGISNGPVCLHSSLRSFGRVQGGGAVVVDAFLEEGCTLLVPSFSWTYEVPPPEDQKRPVRNGLDYEAYARPIEGIDKRYETDSIEIDMDMGAVSAAVVRIKECKRGYHPLCSFSAVGPQAEILVSKQSPIEAFSPLAVLQELGGYVLLAGVGLDNLSLIHLAEKLSGRVLFRRWANDSTGKPMAVEVGSCSKGFRKFKPVLAPVCRHCKVGLSQWHLFLAEQTVTAAVEAIRERPSITHCDDEKCEKCSDAVAGGPII